MVVAQICTEDILMKGGNFEYLTNTTTWLREVGLEPTTFRVNIQYLNTVLVSQIPLVPYSSYFPFPHL